jgi:tRNA (guanosine-2'-O-)-methyltransferase
LFAGAPRKRPRNPKDSYDDKSAVDTLEWETFEFADSPKWDKRFDDDKDGIHVGTAADSQEWEDVEAREAQEDVKLQQRFQRQHEAWQTIDPTLLQQATNVLLPFVMPDRWERIQSIFQKRTRNARFLFENPANPSNVWACLRTLDSFGIQHVDVVIQSGNYKGKAAISQKRGMRTAMGSAKWLTLRNHLTTTHALESAVREDYYIVCTDVNPDSKDIRQVDWDASGKKLLVVMGNEQYGISDEVKAAADETFYLPMTGFAESFNLSVATAIVCAHLSAVSKDDKGPLRPGDLDTHEYNTLLFRGALNSLNRRTALALFRKHGIEFPKDLVL